MSALSEVMDFLTGAKKSASQLGSTLRQARARKAELEGKRKRHTDARMCRSDLESAWHSMVDQYGAQYPRRLREEGTQIERRATRTDLKITEFPNGIFPVLPPSGPGKPISAADMQIALCFFFGDQIKNGISRALAGEDFSEAGPPAAERRKAIAAIDAELEELDKQEARILDLLSEIRQAAEDEPE